MGTGDLWYYTGSRYNIVSTSHRIGSEFKFSNSYYTKWDPNIIKILNVYIMNSCRKNFQVGRIDRNFLRDPGSTTD